MKAGTERIANDQELGQYLWTLYEGVFDEKSMAAHIRGYVGFTFADQMAPQVARFLEPKARLLDIGCGFGAFVIAARRLGLESLGAELAEFEVDYARKRLAAEFPSLDAARVFLADYAQRLPYGDAGFDAVPMLNVLEHVPDTGRMLAEEAGAYFELDRHSPYMLLVAPVRKERCIPADENNFGEDMLHIVNQNRSDIPAVTYVDYSARVRTVYQETNPLYHEVISRFQELTVYGVIVNTSFNVLGEPIVCTPEGAYTCFMGTEMDYLFLDGFWLDKQEQPELDEQTDWRTQFELDWSHGQN